MQGKYYDLEDLHEGMTVSISSLSKIVGTRILLKKNSLVKSGESDYSGVIILIGDDDYKSKGYSINDILPIYNECDLTELC